MKAPRIDTQRLILEPLSSRFNSDAYVAWLNDPEVYRYMETGGNYSSEDLRNFLADVDAKEILFWAITLKENGKHIGNIKIDPIDSKNLWGEYGIMMGDRTEWGKGYAREASHAVIGFCFSNLNLKAIKLGVIEENEAAVHLYQKMGFATDSTYQQKGKHDDKTQTVIRMSFFNKHDNQPVK